MSLADKTKWEGRYTQGSYLLRRYPSPFLEQWLPRFGPAPGAERALDLACGAGRNALHLARSGFRVDAVDIAASALERARASAREQGLSVNWRNEDLDGAELERGAYQVVSVIRYMNRNLVPAIRDALAPAGWLLFEHHFVTEAAVGGPRGTAFRLQPQELLHAFEGLRVVYYLEDIIADPDGRSMALARLVARKQH